jgi:hypothetical protein
MLCCIKFMRNKHLFIGVMSLAAQLGQAQALMHNVVYSLNLSYTSTLGSVTVVHIKYLPLLTHTQKLVSELPCLLIGGARTLLQTLSMYPAASSRFKFTP